MLAICDSGVYASRMTFDFLDSLTDAERRALHTKLSYDLASAGGKSREFSDKETALWRDLGDALPTMHRQPLAAFAERFGLRRYSDAADAFERVAARALPGVVRKPIRDAVRVRMLRCLADMLLGMHVPATAASVLNNIHQIEFAVDQQFPGYIAAGLLHRIIRVAA